MAKESFPQEQKPEATAPEVPQKQSLFSKKLVLFGVPIFILQVVVVYLLVAMFILPVRPEAPGVARSDNEAPTPEQFVQHIFVVKDVIVNPAGTNGTRFLLTTIGFEVSSQEAQQELEKKELQVRDALNTILTSKGLDELVSVQQREALRTEIANRVRELATSGKLTNVYFSKFIIQ